MKPPFRVRTATTLALLGVALLAPGHASAQSTASGGAGAQAASPTPEQRRQAGAAFDQAVAARASGDHANAASLFETADRLAPSAQALGNAVREHAAANTPSHNARAATLALRLLSRHGDDRRIAQYANQLITELSPQLHRVAVSCAGCDLEVDRALSSVLEFFLEPGAHSLTASWSGGRTRSQDLTATAGGRDTVNLEPPAPSGGPAVPGGGAGETERPPGWGGSTPTPTPATPPPRGGGFTPVPAIIFGVATAALGATLIWSGVDTLNGVPAYMNDPTPERLRDGQARELRTNVLIGATAGAGALTMVFAIISGATAGRGGAPRRVDAAPTVAGAAGLAPGLTLGGRF